MNIRAWKAACLLFGSGLCALVYQIAWLREFRLIFGASTAASAAVVAIFIGGLGLGGLLLGKRVDRQKNPLLFYAYLEFGICLTAAATPFLFWLMRSIYIALGGSVTLGMTLATGLRLVFSALILLVPTFLMGGTLPAAVKAIETEEDRSRSGVGLLYGINTLGAVTGCLFANFLLLEVLGTQRTLWIACLLNALVALIARRVSHSSKAADVADLSTASQGVDHAQLSSKKPSVPESKPTVPAWFVLFCAAVVGFVFFLMELVWYRMLGPLLGGTIFTFGLILAIALLGIGLGGAIYGVVKKRRQATVIGFATTCVLEAVLIAIPYALGDGVATLTVLLRPLGALGFFASVLGWSAVTIIVVLPAAMVAGYQFPLLIALLGQGSQEVGKQVGQTYAWNTLGAILGSLAGGFGLLPLLSSPGCWLLVVYALSALGLITLLMALVQNKLSIRILLPSALIVLALVLASAQGPSAFWRHNPIGAGRYPISNAATANNRIRSQNESNSRVYWEAEGVESSVAVVNQDAFSFLVNGKSDGNALNDASTMVMSGLLGGFLHPEPKSAFVVGLGTGETAGWLASIPSIQSVEVAELEEAIIEVARMCKIVNKDVMNNPKVKVLVGDGREILLTSSKSFDLIISEPSNPFRAGIASLFTLEYYQSAIAKLNPGGIFVQWVQAYEVDSQTIRTTYATLAKVFQHIETWQTQKGDLLLLASEQPVVYDVPHLRKRLTQEPYRTGIALVWQDRDLEGVLAHRIAGRGIARAVSELEGDWINTDDKTLIEFGFARTVGQKRGFSADRLLWTAQQRGELKPELKSGSVDWARVEEERAIDMVMQQGLRAKPPIKAKDTKTRLYAFALALAERHQKALTTWKMQEQKAQNLTVMVAIADSLASVGNPNVQSMLSRLEAYLPLEAQMIGSWLLISQGQLDQGGQGLAQAIKRLRENPWPHRFLLKRMFSRLLPLAEKKPNLKKLFLDALSKPFGVHLYNDVRKLLIWGLSGRGKAEQCDELLEQFEPHVPWHPGFLADRRDCYARKNHPLQKQAEADLLMFYRNEPKPFESGLVETADQTASTPNVLK